MYVVDQELISAAADGMATSCIHTYIVCSLRFRKLESLIDGVGCELVQESIKMAALCLTGQQYTHVTKNWDARLYVHIVGM
jgi:hypothetical protein